MNKCNYVIEINYVFDCHWNHGAGNVKADSVWFADFFALEIPFGFGFSAKVLEIQHMGDILAWKIERKNVLKLGII